MAIETATLAGGCFWCLEAVFDQMAGVQSVESGYMGGHTDNPRYPQVCSGQTGHAEVVRVTYDADVVGFADLLGVFFAIHDPTTLNFQGSDVGTQYRSAIFFHGPEQERIARETIARLTAEKAWADPIVTEVTPATTFWQAEDDHQEYFERVGSRNPYCSYVVAPKVAKFRKLFAGRVRKR